MKRAKFKIVHKFNHINFVAMKKHFKTIAIYFLLFMPFFFVIWFTLHFFLPEMNGAIRAGLSGGLTALLAPRLSSYHNQVDKVYQITWFFGFRREL